MLNRTYKSIRGVSYGWWVAITGSVNLIITSGPTFQGSSVLFSAIEAEFGWSRALLTGVASFGRFGGALIGPLEGWLTDKFGPAKMTFFGFNLGGVGFIYLSHVHDPIGYFLSFLILSLGFGIGGFVPAMTAVSRWLPTRRSTGFAVVIAGSSLSGLLIPAFAWGIDEHGWRICCFSIGIVSIAASPFFYWALSRGKTQKPPVKKFQNVEPTGESTFQEISTTDFTAKQAVRTRAFWVIATTHALANFSVAAVSAHVFMHLRDIGLDPIKASTVIPVFAAIGFAFQLFGGLLGDRFEKRFLIASFMFIQSAAMVILAFSETYLMAMIFAVTWGIGFGGRTPIMHAMRAEYFGARAFGTILGLSSFMMSISMIVAPVTIGYVFDVQGTYRWSFLFVATACLIGSILILSATRPLQPSKSEVVKTS